MQNGLEKHKKCHVYIIIEIFIKWTRARSSHFHIWNSHICRVIFKEIFRGCLKIFLYVELHISDISAIGNPPDMEQSNLIFSKIENLLISISTVLDLKMLNLLRVCWIEVTNKEYEGYDKLNIGECAIYYKNFKLFYLNILNFLKIVCNYSYFSSKIPVNKSIWNKIEKDFWMELLFNFIQCQNYLFR